MSLLYLMGAGRSGTTILSLILGSSHEVQSLGELHQLPEHISGEKNCSCGSSLLTCPFWSKLSQEDLELFNKKDYLEQAKCLESHWSIPLYMFSPNRALNYKDYSQANKKLADFSSDNKLILDSAKYIGRALALNSIFRSDIKFIYMVRDPRGVVSSFSKNVQTQRGWLSATLYYLLVNLTAVIVSKTFFRGKVLIVRYEDLILKTSDILSEIASFTGLELEEVIYNIEIGSPLNTGHLIGGNRLVNNKAVLFKKSDVFSWKRKLSKFQRLSIWLLTFPLNYVHRYKL